MIGKLSSPVRREAVRKRTSTLLAPRRAADPSSWMMRTRRLARDYERKTAHAEAMVQFAMIRLMAARLADEHIEPRGPIETEAARRLAEDTND